MHIKKIAAVCWYKLTIRKSSAPCYWWLIKTNPACKCGYKHSKTSPYATLAALAELLALKPLRALGYPIIEDKAACTAKARDEYWHTLLQTLMASQPQLSEEDAVLNTQAQAVVNGYLSASPKLASRALIATTCQKYLFLHRGEVRKNGIAAP